MARMKPNFFIATEQHARVFSPIIKSVGDYSIYTRNSQRNDSIDRVLRFNKIDPEVNRKSVTEMFDDIIHKEESFVLPLMIGTKSHMLYSGNRHYREYMNMNLEDTKGNVCLLGEMVYFSGDRYPVGYNNTPGEYIPHAHVLIARSEPEFSVLSSQSKTESSVVLAGDPSFRPFNGSYESGGRVLMITSCDIFRSNAAKNLIEEMILNIYMAVENGMAISEIAVKPHPAENSIDYRSSVRSMCSSLNIKYKEINRWKIPEDIYKEHDVVLAQSSISSHLALRSMGVESFLYSSEMEDSQDAEFLKITNMPPCKLSDKVSGAYDPVEYDNWINNTFKIDSQTTKRWLNAIK
ncbi:MAG: hypothetical protein HOM01_15270 [Kordiimonadaceae bacterium]|nr:hypothetical protein [Kordiimonadaceae bacterium]